MSRAAARRSSLQLWRGPLVLAVLMVFGLLSALIGQGGILWAASWIALAIPLAVIVFRILARER